MDVHGGRTSARVIRQPDRDRDEDAPQKVEGLQQMNRIVCEPRKVVRVRPCDDVGNVLRDAIRDGVVDGSKLLSGERGDDSWYRDNHSVTITMSLVLLEF